MKTTKKGRGIVSIAFSVMIALALLLASCTQESDTEYIYRNTFTVSFNANGGSGEMESQTFTQGQSQALSKNAFSSPSSGRVFAGWATSASSGEVVYADNEYISVGKNLDLYALWKAAEGDGTGVETKAWNFWSWVDESIRPGDDFFAYATGKMSDSSGGISGMKTICDNFLTENKASEPILNAVVSLFNADDKTDSYTFMQSHLTEIDDAADDDALLTLLAKEIASGTNGAFYGLPASVARGATSLYIQQTEFSTAISSVAKSIATATTPSTTIADMVVTYNDGYPSDYKTAKVTKLKELLEINDDSADTKFVQNAMKFFSKSDGALQEDTTNKPLGTALLAALELSNISAGSDGDGTLNIVAETDETLIDAKAFLKLTYLLASYDLVNSSATLKQYLPLRLPQVHAFKSKYDSDGTSKAYITTMCDNIRKQFITRLENNTWMSKSSKARAKAKAEKMFFSVGYPDDFDETLLFKTKTAGNKSLLEFCQDLYTTALAKYVQLATGTESEGFIYFAFCLKNPIVANAFYYPIDNAFCIFPIWLTNPGSNTAYADAYNYATVGAVIGHEFCHAFDADGSKYNEVGAQEDWWAVSDKLHYEEKKTAMTQLFNMFTLATGATVDGTITLGENMADFGGLTTVYDLFITQKIAEGFAGDELVKQKKMFFQSYAILWSGTNIERWAALIRINNEHSPEIFRVNGTICQFDDWYDIYGVERGDKFYLEPSQRVILW